MRIAVTERPRLRAALNVSALGLTLIAATALRAWDLGRLSFWYDEVVTMRLAEAPSIAELFKLLFRIDATRSPLHPLILQDWLAVFGNSEAAARSLSVVFGVAVTLIALYQGYYAKATPEGVSRATTRTVVAGSLAVLGLDFLLTAWMFGN